MKEIIQTSPGVWILKRMSPGDTGVIFSPFRILVKLPTKIYQVFYDMAMINHDKSYVKRWIFRDLREWVAKEYPLYGIIAFSDYSTTEAVEVSRKTGIDITWGMYLVLELGGDMSPYTVSDLLPDNQKTITDGNEKKVQ